MKRLLSLFFVLVLGFSLTGCGEKLKPAMTYSEFMAAEADAEVVVEGFIVDKQGWWDNKVTMYLATNVPGEGYFIYELPCTEEENNTIYAIGECIHIEATKTIYAGEHEIMGDNITKVCTLTTQNFASVTPIDVTDKLASVEQYQNAYFTATLEVVEFTTTDSDTTVSENKAWGYKGSEPNNDLYFTLSDGTNTLNCCVEVYLTGTNTKVYEDAQKLTIGDKVIVEGYLYWWNGANPHITSIIPSIMTYKEFMDAEDDQRVIVEGFVAAKQSWWNNQVVVYLVGKTPGEGYLGYNLSCSEEENNTLLAIGNYVRIFGYKGSYAEEEEIIDNDRIEVIETTDKPAEAIDLTNKLSSLMDYQNAYFTVTLTVKEYTTTDVNTGIADNRAYGYQGETPTKDLYFILTDGTNDLACCVESYLTNKTTDVYAAVLGLNVGDKVKVTGYLYWWYGANPHIISLEKVNA